MARHFDTPASTRRQYVHSHVRVAAWLLLIFLLPPAATLAAREAETPAREPGELQIIGKLSCSLKRAVLLPYAAEIMALAITPGQAVQAGQELGRFRLTPEAVQALRRRLMPPRIPELEAQLAQLDKDLTAAEARWHTARTLAKEQLASRGEVAETERAVQSLRRSRSALAHSLSEERRLVQEERRLVARQLGVGPPAAGFPTEGRLLAPISGHVLWLHPELRVGAEMKGGEPVLHVGVLDPMLLKARVHERDLPFLSPGLEARVAVDTYPQRTFTARLSRLPWSSPGALEEPAYFEAEFLLPNPDLALKEGLKATLILRKP